jgi:primosomal protein N' (replication factor Y)
MHILTVIPIAKGVGKNTLTYFTKENIAKGSIVSIPLRKKTVYGLVVGSEEAEKAKYDIKSLSYSIRKIDPPAQAGNTKAKRLFSDSFIEACSLIADYYAGSLGSVLSALIPNIVLEKSADINYLPKETPTNGFHETVLLQSNDEERYAVYKSLIREEFARGKSIFFCLPTTEDIKNAKHTLEKGIEKYTFVLHSLLTKKEIVSLWQKIINDTHPVLIIATGSFLSIPRNDISTIVLEKESSRSYKMQVRPYADIRMIAEIIAKQTNRKLVLGDTLLRVETLWKEKNGNYAELSPLKFRLLTTANCEIVDMRIPEDQSKKEFSLFSEKIIEILKKAHENNEQTFLFSGRKGLYPITVCSDCGTVVVCKNCQAPVVLYGKPITQNPEKLKGNNEKSKNLFVCHHCGERRDAQELCTHCRGWRLTPLGIGTEYIFEKIKEMFGDSNIILFDKEHITTHKQAVKLRDAFYNTPGSIMVGTEMALTYLNEPIDNTAVISLDSFFSIPDFRIHEKIFHILLSMRTLSEKNMLIQTRQENNSLNWKLFEYAVRGNLVDFYRDEINDRKNFGYPPFVTYIKLTIEGEKNSVRKEMEEIKKLIEPYKLLSFDAFNPGNTKKFTVHGLISLEKDSWVNKELLDKLRSLPPYVSIRIDPDSLL